MLVLPGAEPNWLVLVFLPGAGTGCELILSNVRMDSVNRIRVTAGSSGRVRATYIQWARREVGIPAFDSRAVEQQPAGGGLLPTDPRLPFSFLPRVAWPWMEVWARVDLTRRR